MLSTSSATVPANLSEEALHMLRATVAAAVAEHIGPARPFILVTARST